MFKGIKSIFLLFILALLCNIITVPGVFASSVNPPVILSIDQQEARHLARPLVTGLTLANTEVLIYIDGIFHSNAWINQADTGTDNFYFQPPELLAEGRHTIMAKARDRTSLAMSAPSSEWEFFITPLPAPSLIAPHEATVTGQVKPFITGLTLSGTKVHVFIDNKLNGGTDIMNHESGTANFAYRPFLNLAVGEHTAWAIAEDVSGRKSRISNKLRFRVEEPMPAPIIYEPVVNSRTNVAQPFITGLAKNDTAVRVFIDHKLNGHFSVVNHESGTANFAYQPFLELTPGPHLVYTTALDSRGKESAWSNIVYFTVNRLAEPAISAEAAEETSIRPEPEIIPEPVIEPIPEETEKTIEPSPEEVDISDEAVSEEIQDIISPTEEQGEDTGLIDEGKESQSKLQLNLIIFLLFLAAVIAWIFWVNRELIKERREQGKEKDKKDKINLR